jgi:hypothetical protein
MPVRDTLQRIVTEYAGAKGQPFAGHALAGFIRHSAAEAVKDALNPEDLKPREVAENRRNSRQQSED